RAQPGDRPGNPGPDVGLDASAARSGETPHQRRLARRVAGRRGLGAMPRLRITVLDHPATLAGHMAAWNELAAAALEPNVFHEPWMMLPAIDSFGGGELRYVLVYAEQADAPPLLCGLFPLERVARYNGLPFPHVRLWHHKHCYLGTPLVRATHARACLDAFLDWLEADAHGASAVKWGSIAADGPFWRTLAQALAESGRRSFVPYRFERAAMRPRA